MSYVICCFVSFLATTNEQGRLGKHRLHVTVADILSASIAIYFEVNIILLPLPLACGTLLLVVYIHVYNVYIPVPGRCVIRVIAASCCR